MVTRNRRRIARWLVVGVLILVGLNVVGLVRYPGGPLRDGSANGMLALDIRPAGQGYSQVGNVPTDWARVGHPLYFGMVHIYNASPVTATIEAVTPLDLTPGLSIDRILLGRPSGADVAMDWADVPGMTGDLPNTDVTLSGVMHPPPIAVPPTSSDDAAGTTVLIVVSAREAGVYGFRGVAVDYRVGPFTFRAVQYLALRTCIGPFASGEVCAFTGLGA
jgi:hypothetical protein